MSGFLALFVAIPSALFVMVRSQRDPAQIDQDADGKNRGSFREWAAGEFDTWQDRVQGANAAVEILLPIAALAIGMTAFAIVFNFTVPST